MIAVVLAVGLVSMWLLRMLAARIVSHGDAGIGDEAQRWLDGRSG